MNWLAFSLVAMICWGIWSFLMKLASNYFSWYTIFVISSGSTIVASFLIMVFMRPNIDVRSLGFGYAILAGVAGTLALFAFYSAIGSGNALIVVPLTALYPLITIVLSYVILSEKITVVRGLGVILALTAILIMSIE